MSTKTGRSMEVEFVVAAHGENLSWLNSVHCRKTIYETGDPATGSKHDNHWMEQALTLAPQGMHRMLRRELEAVLVNWRTHKGQARAHCEQLAEDGRTTIIHLPNSEGMREANQYLHHLTPRHDSLADYTVFCQGYPFDQVPDLLGLVLGNLCDFSTLPPVEPTPLDEIEARTWPGVKLIRPFLKRMTGRDFDHCSYCNGQAWIASRRFLQRHPLSFYERLQAEGRAFGLYFGHVMECCWAELLLHDHGSQPPHV